MTQVKACPQPVAYHDRVLSLHNPRTVLLNLAAQAAQAGLVSASCGNASVRGGPCTLVITASGSELHQLTELELSEVTLTGELLRGPRPSCELEMHLAAYRQRPETQAVLHTHAPWATLMACLQQPIDDLNFLVEIPLFVGRHATVPFFSPGSTMLADAVGKALRDPSVHLVQLRHHGQVALGSSAKEALHRAILFERACWMALQGFPLERLPDHLQLSGSACQPPPA